TNIIEMRHPNGDVSQSDFGWSIKLGHYNNDSTLDMMISAPYEFSMITKGEVYLYLGGPGFPQNPVLYQRPEQSGNARDKFGADTDFLNDVDGDGFADLVFGGPAFGGDSLHFGPGRTWIKRGNVWSWFDDPTPDTGNDIYGWGSALATGR